MFLQVLSAAVSSLSGPCPAAGSRELREADVRRLGRGLRDGPTDLRTGAGVLGDAVVAPVARQVGDQAHVILAAGFHTAGIPRARRGQSAASRPLAVLPRASPNRIGYLVAML